jgi:16S rRNA (guanine966-N2)-methyltransferase
VREALFSILDSRGALAGARVIDFYAGTGALGLEALSRGAVFATFVESDRRALEALGKNVDALRERDRVRILPVSVARAATTLANEQATLVFCDPPYADLAAATALLASVAENHALARGATIVLEHATRDKPTLAAPSLREADRRVYGDTTLSLYAFEEVYTRGTS